MPIVVEAVASPSARRAWLRLPFQVYAHDPYWTPLLQRSERRSMQVTSSRLRTTRFLAFEGAQVVGRVECTVVGEADEVQLSRYESVDDDRVPAALFAAAAEHATRQGRSRLVGPRGSLLLGGLAGLQVSGFDRPSPIGNPHHPRYYERQWTQVGGFGLHSEMVSFAVEREGQEMPLWLRDSAAAAHAAGYRAPTLHRFADLARHADRLREILNTTFAELPNWLPITPAETPAMIANLRPMVIPELVRLVFHGDEVVGLLAAYPDPGAALRRCRGRLLPLGWRHLLREYRHGGTLTFVAAAVLPQHQARGALTCAAVALYDQVLADPRWHTVEFPHVEAGNERSRSIIEGVVGAHEVARLHVYERSALTGIVS